MSYFMGCIALVRCELVLRCGLAGVVWCGIRMQDEACIRIPHHPTPVKPQGNTITHLTRAIQPMK